MYPHCLYPVLICISSIVYIHFDTDICRNQYIVVISRFQDDKFSHNGFEIHAVKFPPHWKWIFIFLQLFAVWSWYFINRLSGDSLTENFHGTHHKIIRKLMRYKFEGELHFHNSLKYSQGNLTISSVPGILGMNLLSLHLDEQQ